MAPEVKEKTNMICEQGSMGLWVNPLSEEEQKLYDVSEDEQKTIDENASEE